MREFVKWYKRTIHVPRIFLFTVNSFKTNNFLDILCYDTSFIYLCHVLSIFFCWINP